MADLMVYELIMYSINEVTGKETFYDYNGDCSCICDIIDGDDCKVIDYKPANREPNYKEGFNLVMQYWDSIADEEKPKLSKQLEEIGL